jgi:hypothetical protein
MSKTLFAAVLAAGLIAARERLKKCAAEWKEAKAAGKIE